MFSYFPCKLFSECANGFERPKISPKGKLKELISPGLKQNFKTNELNNDAVKPLWDEVKKQVLEQECLLGIKVEMPKKSEPTTSETPFLNSPSLTDKRLSPGWLIIC